jgi:glycosyltransferase involved in cell wall biosynthesis
MLATVDSVSRGANEVVSKPLVSIIIIFLNEERFLEEAIGSVLAQSYANWELLLVDDGSTDGSGEIAQRHAASYAEKVRYLEHSAHKNQGMSASRNLGIRHAKGDYIAFLDADDVWLSNKLDRQVAIMDLQPEAAMLYGSPLLWHGWTGQSADIERDRLQPITVAPNSLIRPPQLLALFLARKAITPAPSDVLLRRDSIRRVGGFEDCFRGLYEDQVFFSKLSLEMAVFISNECWLRHRQHEDSACSLGRITGEYHSGHVVFLNWMSKYLSARGFQHTELWNILQQELRRYRQPFISRSIKHALRCMRQVKNRAFGLARKTLPLIP